MTEMDGVAATTMIRKGEREKGKGKPTTPIIAMTANDMPEDREKCLEADMDDYHAKRVKQKDLVATIPKWIASQSIPNEQ